MHSASSFLFPPSFIHFVTTILFTILFPLESTDPLCSHTCMGHCLSFHLVTTILFPLESTDPLCSHTFIPQQLLSASSGGSLKIFDLTTTKVTRSLNGHLASPTTLSYHPFGDFIASGANDTNVKLWDVRHKRCIQTYKGHGGPVSEVRFSPDGQWVASCCKDDGTMKVRKPQALCLPRFHARHIAALATISLAPCIHLALPVFGVPFPICSHCVCGRVCGPFVAP